MLDPSNPVQRGDEGAGQTEAEERARRGRAGDDLTRRRLLGRSAAVAAVAVPAGMLAVHSLSQSVASANGALPGAGRAAQGPAMPLASVAAAFQEIQSDENAHVTFLKSALGSNARPKPTFKGLDQSSVSSFLNLSRTFENVGVGAYLLGAGAISSKQTLTAAAGILAIEARHAGFLDYIQGQPLSPNGAIDKPLSQSQVVTDVSPFIASLNGGSDPSGQLANDNDILNFALLLEYLEAEFYNLNVPKFYGGSVPGNG